MNQPFGFSSSDDDGRDDDRDANPGGPGDAGGFGFGGAGGFDPSQFGDLGKMISQFGQMRPSRTKSPSSCTMA